MTVVSVAVRATISASAIAEQNGFARGRNFASNIWELDAGLRVGTWQAALCEDRSPTAQPALLALDIRAELQSVSRDWLRASFAAMGVFRERRRSLQSLYAGNAGFYSTIGLRVAPLQARTRGGTEVPRCWEAL